MNVEHVALDAVRIGSAFTGRVITHSETPLHRLGRLEAEVVDMKEVPAGYAVGYNGTFVTKRPTTIAIVPMGHYDGFGLTKEKEDHNFHSVLSALKQFLNKAHLTVTINGKAYPGDRRGRAVPHGGGCDRQQRTARRYCHMRPVTLAGESPRTPRLYGIIQKATCILQIQVAFYFLNTLRRRFSILRTYNSSATPSSRS